MAYTNLQSSECLNSSRIVLNNNWAGFESRLNNLDFDYANVTTNLNNLNSIYLTNQAVVQQRVVSYTNALIRGTQNGFIRTNLLLAITKKRPNTKFLIELTGGRYYYTFRKGMYTHFFGSTNLSTTETNLFSGPVEYISFDSGSGTIIQGAHNIKALYTPPSNVTTLNLRVFVEKSVADTNTNEYWNYFIDGDPKSNVPVVLSITEIV